MWLTKPLVQRITYLLLFILCLYLFSSNGLLRKAGTFTTASVSSALVVFSLLGALGAQLLWNKKWLWMLLCVGMVIFTFWLATLSLSQIINGAGAPGKSLVWGVGVIGFTVVLVLMLAFLNWVLLHMKPRK